MIDVHYASLTSQAVQHGVFYPDGHPSRYQPRPTGPLLKTMHSMPLLFHSPSLKKSRDSSISNTENYANFIAMTLC